MGPGRAWLSATFSGIDRFAHPSPDGRQRRPRGEDLGDPLCFQHRDIGLGDDPPDQDQYIAATIALTWQEHLQPNGLPIGYYQILQGTTPGQLTQVASRSDTMYTATSLNGNTTYYFEIVAVDTGHNVSAPSAQMSVTTLPAPRPARQRHGHGKRRDPSDDNLV